MPQKIYANITDTIGNTPLVRLNKVTNGLGAQVALKLEFFNPMSSVKDRMALAMIDDAAARGLLLPGGHIVEPTSGNTGIGLAFVAAARGYKLTVVMPETMSIERRLVLKMLGADIVLTPGPNGMAGAIAVATEYAQKTGAFMPQQFENPANPAAHTKTTAEEIWADTDGKVAIFVSGVGTGGTITGVGKVLKARSPGVKVVAVEPAESPVLSGGKPAPHKIQGIGAGFVPLILDTNVYDEIMCIDSATALQTARDVIQQEGIPLGISSGATVAAALKLAARPENTGKLIVAIAASGLERYLSTALTENARDEVARIPVTPVPVL